MSFRSQLIQILEGFTPANPLCVSPSAYRDFMTMPEIADLMPRLATDDRVAAGCAGKEAFRDPQAASKAVRRIQRSRTRKRHRSADRKAYRCPACGHWHIGRR